jgi:hypothetical protein
LGIEPELVGHGHREVDELPAVTPRVGVVSLGDVPEQERGPAIRSAELEGVAI